MKPALIVHGGAWNIPDEALEDCRDGCRRALEAGGAVLARGGKALDAVEAAIVVLEDDPTFDAGIGSHLNRDGRVELDAIVMDGRTLKAGAVAAVERVRNPIRLARRVLESSEHMMLVGAGAEQFAVEQGVALCRPEELVVERERAAWARCMAAPRHRSEHHFGHESGTVGAVAVDAEGNVVAGTSTGGTCCKLPGRIGDSPLIGCGCYADEAGGVSCTGWGEAIMKVVLAKAAADLLRGSSTATLGGAPSPSPRPSSPGCAPMDAARACVELLASRTGGTGGLILLDREGRPGFAFNTPHMAYGHMGADGCAVIGV